MVTKIVWDGKKERRVSEDDDRRKVCFMHTASIDRIEAHIENQDRDQIQSTKDRAEESKAFSTFIGKAQVAGLIFLAIYAAGFLYTRSVDVEAKATAALQRVMIDNNNARNAEMKSDSRILFFKLENLTSEISKSNIQFEKANTQNEKLIQMLIEREEQHGQAARDRLQQTTPAKKRWDEVYTE